MEISTPADAQYLDISMIHQELSLIPHLTVGQNVYLGREPRARIPGFVDWSTLYAQAQRLLVILLAICLIFALTRDPTSACGGGSLYQLCNC